MKKIFRHFAIDTLTLYAVSLFTAGLVFEKGLTTILLAGASLTVASLLARPVINLLLLPINLITFNLFKWVSSAIALYLVTLVVPGFKITHFYFAGMASNLFTIPPFSLEGILSYAVFAFIISFITSSIYWIVK
jgi:putative membrane protein